MKFTRNNINEELYIDNVFSIGNKAKADPLGINAAQGCLYDEDGKLYTYKCVYDLESSLPFEKQAAYAEGSQGNASFLNEVAKFVLQDKVNHYRSVATAGGTGALYLSLKSCLNENDTIIIPEISWGNYRLMAKELNLNVLTYDPYDLNSLYKCFDEVKKVFMIINSPCENPCGGSYNNDEWQQIIDKINSLNKEVILCNDIAYYDYAKEDKRNYFRLFNNINDNVLVLIAYSLSKSFSYYGKRLGCLFIINNDEEFLDHYQNLCIRLCRTTWSNVNNGSMIVVSKVLKEHLREYQKELADVSNMLRKRADLFLEKAKEVNLPLYPYQDGFFMTLKFEDNDIRDKAHQALLDNHIYAIKFNKGIRISICSLSLNKIKDLPKKISDVITSL